MEAYCKAVYLSDENTIQRDCSYGSTQSGVSSETRNEMGRNKVRKFLEDNNIYKGIRTNILIFLFSMRCKSLQPSRPKKVELSELTTE